MQYIGYSDLGLPIYEINRSQVFINNKIPDVLLYVMADKMSKSIYPIRFSINDNEEIEIIENFGEILNRCKETEIKLKNYYTGNTSDKIIKNFNSHYSNSSTIKNELQNNIFFSILFFSSQKHLNLHSSHQTTFKFNIAGKEIKLPVWHEIEPFYSDTKKINVNFLGLENVDNVNAFKINFKLEEGNYTISAVTGKIVYEVNNISTSFEFECYHIKD